MKPVSITTQKAIDGIETAGSDTPPVAIPEWAKWLCAPHTQPSELATRESWVLAMQASSALSPQEQQRTTPWPAE